MKVTNPQILYALSACFATSAAAVASVYTSAFGALICTLLALAASLITLSLAWHHREHIEVLSRYAEFIATAGMFIFLPSILIWGLLPGLLVFLAFAQFALNLQLVEHKHVHYGLLVSFICLFMGAAQAITGYYLVFMAIYASAAAVCLSTLNSDEQGSSHVPFHLRSSMRLVAWLLSLTFIVYIVLPRPPAANLGSQHSVAAKYYEESEWGDDPDSGDADRNANSDDDSSSSGDTDIASNQGRVFESASQDPTGYHYHGFEHNFSILDNSRNSSQGNALLALMSAPHGVYLKVESFDRFDGLSWHKSFTHQERQKLHTLSLELDAGQEANFQHTITLVNDLGPYIPAAPVAVKLHFPADSIALDAYRNLKLPARLQKDIVFTIESFISYHQRRPFAGTTVPPRDSDLALYEGFDERISRLAEKVTQDATDGMGKALLLEAFLKQNYQYDTNSIFNSQQNTPLDRFLFETRAGHCEFFASALAVMLRSQGIPSRLVTGFSATTMNPLTGYYEIYSLDGHAWVEAWIDGKGWMLLEATPPYQLPSAETETMTARQLEKYVEELRKYSALGNVDMPSLAELWSFAADQFRAFMRYLRELTAKYITELTLTSAILLCCWILYRRFKDTVMAWRLYWRVKHYQHSNTPQDAVFYMQHIHQLLQIRDQPRLPGNSIESFSRHAAFQGLDQTCLQRLAEHINRRFYENIRHEINGELFKKVFFHVYNRT